MLTLQEQFGPIDIYLFDQLLRGRILPGMRILDAGCGSGRNLIYLLREGYEVYAADADPTTRLTG
jgi:tellurite methyltransferase